MVEVPTSIDGYPLAQIDPREKGFHWILQYAKAAYKDSRGYMPVGTLNIGNLKMSEIKMYTMGRQSVDKYKKMLSIGNPTDESWRAIDWTPPAFMCKFREIAISKLLQKKYDIQAYAIDPLAQSEEDDYFNKMKVKIIMREAAEQAGSDLANSPTLAPQPGEPQDLEQLDMQQEFGYKHIMAMEAEQAYELIFQHNGIEEKRKEAITNEFDYGVGGYTSWIDENGMVKFRAINPEYLGLSYCEKADFSDLVHWFEIVPTYVGDLAPYYSKTQMDDICQKAQGQNGNPSSYTPTTGLFNQAWNRFKVMVMKIKFLSYNDTVYKEEMDGRGNVRFGKSSYKNRQFLNVNENGKLTESDEEYNETGEANESEEGQPTPKYINSCKKVRYKGSWVLNTEYMHDWGLDINQNRKLSSWWDTDLDIQLYAWNFYKMQFTGIAERLIPLEDRACMAWFNLQNLSNKLIPYLINIEMNSIEGAFPYGKGGTKGKPSDVIDFIFSNFVVPYRATDLQSRNPNFKPVSIEATGQLAAFGQLYDELNHTIEMMRQISGLNELTDGSTPNAKTLVPVAESAIQSTNNALYLISLADKNLIQRLADSIIGKVQIAVKLGKVQGYAKALGGNAVKFFNINPDISLHELGIFIEDAPDDAQREALWQDVNIKESQGLLDIADKIMIMSCRNLKEAAIVLSYKIQKRKEELHQQQIQVQQTTAQGNMQSLQLGEQLKQQTIQVQHQADMELASVQGQWQYIIEMAKKEQDIKSANIQGQAKVISNQIISEAKVESTKIAAHADLGGKHLQGQYNLVTTQMDNETDKHIAKNKPKPTKAS